MGSPLNLIKLPTNKEEYKNYLTNYYKIKNVSQKDISNTYKLYHMMHKDQSYLECEIAKKIKLKDLNFRNSSELNKFNAKIIKNYSYFNL